MFHKYIVDVTMCIRLFLEHYSQVGVGISLSHALCVRSSSNMADATDDVLESVLQVAPEEQLSFPKMFKQYASECALPGCVDQADEPC